MAGSEAEERIRARAEQRLRGLFPTARIIHELQLEQGGVRIDLAAVTEDHLCVVEIKSERDTLERLSRQIMRATQVADEVWICVAAKHATRLEEIKCWWKEKDEAKAKAYRLEARALYGAEVFVENSLGILGAWEHRRERRDKLFTDPRARFDLLWAEEQRSAIGRHFGGAGMGRAEALTRGQLCRLAVEHMSGRELRRHVCQQLRARHFPRADPPVSLIEETDA